IQGWPVLVIDAGTALTFTGAEADHRLVGGAILPGLGLSVRSLAQSTAALPRIELPHTLPSRWAITTAEAITSGIVYTTLAGTIDFIEAWWQEFPEGWIVLTGGDHAVLFNYLTAGSTRTACSPDWMARLIRDPHLVFWGLRSLRQLACA
ncbi:MAG TPA: type III pantothenate kinase, partial [Candidatus Caenarcaniphilales bacterium]